jgi:hypothetical protein
METLFLPHELRTDTNHRLTRWKEKEDGWELEYSQGALALTLPGGAVRKWTPAGPSAAANALENLRFAVSVDKHLSFCRLRALFASDVKFWNEQAEASRRDFWFSN